MYGGTALLLSLRERRRLLLTAADPFAFAARTHDEVMHVHMYADLCAHGSSGARSWLEISMCPFAGVSGVQALPRRQELEPVPARRVRAITAGLPLCPDELKVWTVRRLEQLGREHRRRDACDAVGDGDAFDRLEQHDEPAFERLEEGLEVLGAQARARRLLLVTRRRESGSPLLDELLGERLAAESSLSRSLRLRLRMCRKVDLHSSNY